MGIDEYKKELNELASAQNANPGYWRLYNLAILLLRDLRAAQQKPELGNA